MVSSSEEIVLTRLTEELEFDMLTALVTKNDLRSELEGTVTMVSVSDSSPSIEFWDNFKRE